MVGQVCQYIHKLTISSLPNAGGCHTELVEVRKGQYPRAKQSVQAIALILRQAQDDSPEIDLS